MLEIARNCAPEQYERVIVVKKSWPILYHFSALRENIISWFPLKKTDRVLEIGGGPGAITGALCRSAAEVTWHRSVAKTLSDQCVPSSGLRKSDVSRREFSRISSRNWSRSTI